MHLPFTAKDIQDISASHSEQIYKETMALGPFRFTHEKRPPNHRIRVGYVSYDFRTHAVGWVIQGMFAFHNKTKFQIIAYNNGDSLSDPVYLKIKSTVDHVVQIDKMSPAEAAHRVYADKIDILIDLGLFTAYNRMDIFPPHPAPVQMSWLGLACPTGAKFFDYLLVDRVVAPPETRPYFTEKLLYMPHSYHVNNHKQFYPIKAIPSRKDHNLPNTFLFCNHANVIRHEPMTFRHWVNILKKVENSTMVIKHHNDDSVTNLREEARRAGLFIHETDLSSRMLFQRGSGTDHIEIKSMCNLYLDVHNYNGHSTTADILWAGVPIVSYPGEVMASRVAASFATAAGFPEMVASSWDDYERKAVEYATNSARYEMVHKKLMDARMEMPLFDTQRFIANLEKGLLAIYNRWETGKRPQDYFIQDTQYVVSL